MEFSKLVKLWRQVPEVVSCNCRIVYNLWNFLILWSCEGKCLRSFHATVEAGSDSDCVSLGFSDEQVEVRLLFIYSHGLICSVLIFTYLILMCDNQTLQAIQNFYCKNCQYKRHQCYACGKLGSSDDKSSACEVCLELNLWCLKVRYTLLV